jgi:hypothetical protein
VQEGEEETPLGGRCQEGKVQEAQEEAPLDQRS